MKSRLPIGLTLALALAVSACGDELVLSVPVVEEAITAQTAAAIVDVKVPFSDGAFFAPQFAGSSFELEFTSTTTFKAKGGGSEIDGTVSYGSCTFTWPGGSKFFETCSINVNGSNKDVTVELGSTLSEPTNASVKITESTTNPGTCNVTVGNTIISSAPCTKSS